MWFLLCFGYVHLLKTTFIFSYAALIRHNRPGVSALKLANGYAGLRDALASDSVDVLHPKIHSSVFSLKSFPENPATKNG